jgi:hypothetical protein
MATTLETTDAAACLLLQLLPLVFREGDLDKSVPGRRI